MKDRRDTLAAVLSDLEARVLAVKGGIAEIDYLTEQLTPPAHAFPAPSDPPTLKPDEE